jgi:hypothetical protein
MMGVIVVCLYNLRLAANPKRLEPHTKVCRANRKDPSFFQK